MILIADILSSINSAFPLFSYGERHIDEFLEKYSFDEIGITRQWEMFDLLSNNVAAFLRSRFPTLGEPNRSICRELQMCRLREKIEAKERAYAGYRSIVAQYS